MLKTVLALGLLLDCGNGQQATPLMRRSVALHREVERSSGTKLDWWESNPFLHALRRHIAALKKIASKPECPQGDTCTEPPCPETLAWWHPAFNAPKDGNGCPTCPQFLYGYDGNGICRTDHFVRGASLGVLDRFANKACCEAYKEAKALPAAVAFAAAHEAAAKKTKELDAAAQNSGEEAVVKKAEEKAAAIKYKEEAEAARKGEEEALAKKAEAEAANPQKVDLFERKNKEAAEAGQKAKELVQVARIAQNYSMTKQLEAETAANKAEEAAERFKKDKEEAAAAAAAAAKKWSEKDLQPTGTVTVKIKSGKDIPYRSGDMSTLYVEVRTGTQSPQTTTPMTDDNTNPERTEDHSWLANPVWNDDKHFHINASSTDQEVLALQVSDHGSWSNFHLDGNDKISDVYVLFRTLAPHQWAVFDEDLVTSEGEAAGSIQFEVKWAPSS